ncbi:hypothetical protein Q7Y95_05595 [Glaesserella parasuis]|uniref:hypothetical protein n=1 Tax=Glaesserella parasuis TaxID=738 RepID=UPI00049FFE0B|nr:hypothetical protein [Glaesserella parasuis]KDD79226.1 hypothetical protein HPS42_10775 [Glaesserella parasuis ST4-2]MDE3998268.1 hypothetical protein [Glaesserella parasuis]MDG6274350.1 hypothetical protein [Glaesserella parasuis]MDG6278535.1 hypothetical protein [Glaesserella parasuis]MDG6299389.1 hypothetical protein [Glaesserella parasuis]
MIIQEFLSLTEASDFVKSKGIHLEEWDLIFLASKREFKVFNNIYPIPRIKESNQLYKINGLKGIFELCTETQIIEVLEEAQKITEENSNVEAIISQNGYFSEMTLKDINTGNELVFLCNASRLIELRYPYASIHFPVYDGLEKQFDTISGMVESRMLEYLSERNFLTPKLFYAMLKKSLSNFYIVNSPLDIYFFKLTELIFYPIGLRPYHIKKDELNKNLREIYSEDDFSTLFYFRKKELEIYIEKLLQSNSTNNLDLDNTLYLLAEVINAVKSKNKKWTQSTIIDEILTQRQEEQRSGLEQRKIEEYFSTANKLFKAK